MNDPVTSTWVFGGPLADAPAPVAWAILVAVAALGAVAVGVSYRNSVGQLGSARRVLLMLLRCTLLGTLLFCLANPVRIQRQTRSLPEPSSPPPSRLAVLIDRSDSMTLPDNRGRSRLDDALTHWRRLRAAAEKHFGTTDYFSFAEDLRAAKTLDEAAARSGGTAGTRLYGTAATLLKQPAGKRPDALVILTDGVDTSNDSEALLRDSALAAGTPVYFVAGNNRSARPEPYLRVREWRVPATALRGTEFTIEATFEAFSRADRTVPFSIWQARRRLTQDELALTIGSNLITRSFAVSAGEPATVEFALKLGLGDEAPFAARAVTEVLAPRANKIRVLVYQSALDWGLRHFATALRTDPAFEFRTIVTPDVGLTISGGSQSGGATLGTLPTDPKLLAAFDCVVLVRVAPKRLSTAQQNALVEFARGGGSVLFMSPDAEAIRQINTGPLSSLLPVDIRSDGSATTVQRNPSRPTLPNQFAKSADAARSRAAGKLTSFTVTDTGRASPIFAQAGKRDEVLVPRFVEYVKLHRAKPGADVLAVHPTDADGGSGAPHILLATHAFGSGRCALLTTDTLWRWKLDEPSESRVVETFWQQLLLALGRRRETRSLRFADTPAQIRLGIPTTLRIGGLESEQLPAVVARPPDGQSVTLPVKRTEDPAAAWVVDWAPDRAGVWELRATTEGANPASIFPIVMSEIAGELAPSVPALERLRALAGETGGALLTREAPVEWKTESERETRLGPVASERTFLRWNSWTILGLALGCFSLELILRRLWKLL